MEAKGLGPLEIERVHSPSILAAENTSKHGGLADWAPEEERGLMSVIASSFFQGSRADKTYSKKIDWRMLPMLCVVFGISLLDRANISAAYIAGMGKFLELATGN